jgi:hypothetical protein
MIVWIFREQRSGSTAFTNLVANRLNRAELFLDPRRNDIEMIKNIPYPERYVFSTHHSYDLTEIMNLHDKPVTLIRCARKDKIERCLSYLIIQYKNARERPETRSRSIRRTNLPFEYDSFIANIEPTTFTKKEIYNYLQDHAALDQYWKNCTVLYQTCTVFYEDLCTERGVDLPMLGLNSLNIINDDSATVKLPNDYKKQVCLNYDMVVRWITEYYSENAQVVEW